MMYVPYFASKRISGAQSVALGRDGYEREVNGHIASMRLNPDH